MPVADMYPSLRGHIDLAFTTPDKATLTKCDVVFFATPHGVAMAQARELLAAGVKIIDLAADFRLQGHRSIREVVRHAPTCPDILREAVYGLPELNREASRRRASSAIPGCYPTSVQLGFAPLLKARPGRCDAPDRRLRVGRVGRRPQGRSRTCSSRRRPTTQGLRREGPPPRARDQRAIATRSPAQPEVQCIFVPHLVPIDPRHSFDAVRASDRQGPGYRSAGPVREASIEGETFVDVMPAGSHPETRSVRASKSRASPCTRPQPRHCRWCSSSRTT